MSFQRPEFLLFLLLLVPFFLFIRKKKRVSLQIPSFFLIENLGQARLSALLEAVENAAFLILVLIFLTAASPQLKGTYREISVAGVDIMVVLDVSSSMASQDFGGKSRLEMAKEVVREFIKKRTSDRIGLMAFAASPFLLSPLTVDRQFLEEALDQIRIGDIEDGTAIGLALADAVARLEKGPAASKLVVLLTDGMNNKGEITPLDAAKLAQGAGVKVYTIGVGRRGRAKVPVEMPFGMTFVEKEVDIDEPVLMRIASMTGGRYYRADERGALERIFSRIDSLEKTPIRFRIREESRPLRGPLTLLLWALAFTWYVAKYLFLWRRWY